MTYRHATDWSDADRTGETALIGDMDGVRLWNEHHEQCLYMLTDAANCRMCQRLRPATRRVRFRALTDRLTESLCAVACEYAEAFVKVAAVLALIGIGFAVRCLSEGSV